MNDPISDEDLAALFAREREAGEERAPDFQTMRIRAFGQTDTAGSGDSKARSLPMRAGRATIWRWGIPAMAMAMVVLGLGIVLVGQHRRPAPTASRDEVLREMARIDAALQADLARQSALTAWQSPTDFLLQSIPPKLP